MEVNGERNKKGFGPTCTKYILFLLSIGFVIASVLAISTGISSVAAFSSYYDMMAFGLDTVSTLWILVGVIFFIVALFGIFVAFKESTAAANFYGITMMVVFVLQISVSIYSFTLINDTQYMVSRQLQTMMKHYSHEYQLEVDWIQTNFQCCGIKGPSDWQDFDRFSTPSPYYNQWDDRYDSYSPTIETPLNETDLMPVSCCEQYSNYVNLKCEHYHSDGCFEPIHQIVFASVMLIGTTGLILSVLQVLGIILGFLYARIVRSKKTQRDIRIWNSGLTNDQVDSPSVRQQTDYSPIQW